MAKIKLKRNWFGPGGQRYKAAAGLHSIPDELLSQVPTDAEVFTDDGKPVVKPKAEHEPAEKPAPTITAFTDEELQKELDRREEVALEKAKAAKAALAEKEAAAKVAADKAAEEKKAAEAAKAAKKE